MRTSILIMFVALVGIASAASVPDQPLETPDQYIRTARENPEPQPEPKKDLEGAESAFVAYPYASPYWVHPVVHRYPYVSPYVVIGK